jgi:hypothetical protein
MYAWHNGGDVRFRATRPTVYVRTVFEGKEARFKYTAGTRKAQLERDAERRYDARPLECDTAPGDGCTVVMRMVDNP